MASINESGKYVASIYCKIQEKKYSLSNPLTGIGTKMGKNNRYTSTSLKGKNVGRNNRYLPLSLKNLEIQIEAR